MTNSFESLGVDAALVKALSERGIDRAFPIQQLTIADALAGRDVCGKAKTGSGNTLRSPAYSYSARNVSGPIENSASGGSGDSFTRRSAIIVPLSESRSRIISSPSASYNSQCRRLIIGWAIVRPAFRLRPITVGNFREMLPLLAFPPITFSFASIPPMLASN